MLHLDEWEYDDIASALDGWVDAACLPMPDEHYDPVTVRAEFRRAVDRIDQLLLAARARRVRTSPAATFSPPSDDSA